MLSTADIEKGCFFTSGPYHHHTDPSIMVVCNIDVYSAANYTCIATNVYGSTSKSMQLVVMRKFEIRKREISEELHVLL